MKKGRKERNKEEREGRKKGEGTKGRYGAGEGGEERRKENNILSISSQKRDKAIKCKDIHPGQFCCG